MQSSNPGSGQPALGSTQPLAQLLPAALFSGLNLAEREADNSSLSSAKAKNQWSYKAYTYSS